MYITNTKQCLHSLSVFYTRIHIYIRFYSSLLLTRGYNTYIYIQTQIHIHTHIYTYVCAYMWLCIWVCVYLCEYYIFVFKFGLYVSIKPMASSKNIVSAGFPLHNWYSKFNYLYHCSNCHAFLRKCKCLKLNKVINAITRFKRNTISKYWVWILSRYLRTKSYKFYYPITTIIIKYNYQVLCK